jgi:1-phosphofructokinase
MIVTLTCNTGLDHTLVVSEFRKNDTLRAAEAALSMSSKPTDCSFILGTLGIPSIALGFAAGHIGDLVEKLLRERGVETRFTRVAGSSRVNTILLDRSDGTMTTVTSAPLIVRAAHVDALRESLLEHLPDARVLVIGGTMPRGVPPALYGELIPLARAAGVPVIFDASEPYLSAGVAGKPTVVKPNRHELAEWTGQSVDTPDAALMAARALHQRHGVQLVVSLDKDGAAAVFDHAAYLVPPLNVPVVSAAGAGDAVLAGLAASIARGEPIEEGLRLGIAASAAVCMQLGTAECDPADVARLLPEVRLVRVAQ